MEEPKKDTKEEIEKRIEELKERIKIETNKLVLLKLEDFIKTIDNGENEEEIGLSKEEYGTLCQMITERR